MSRYETTLSAYIFYMNWVQSTMWLEALVCIHFMLLAYFPVQTCIPHCVCMSHCTSAVVYILTPHYCMHPSEINKLEHLLTILLQHMCQLLLYALKYHVHAKCQNYFTWISGGHMLIWHMKSLVLTMWPGTLYTKDDDDDDDDDDDAGWQRLTMPQPSYRLLRWPLDQISQPVPIQLSPFSITFSVLSKILLLLV